MEKWQNPDILTIWIVIVIVVVVVLLVSIVIYYRIYIKNILAVRDQLHETKLENQIQLSNASITILEKERNRLAMELHDGLLNKLNLTLLSYQVQKNEAKINSMIQDCITEARRISHDLYPPMLSYSSFTELLTQVVAPLQFQYGLQLTTIDLPSPPLKDEIKLHLIRICQEILTNIIKHANATKISVDVRASSGSIYWAIQDNGKGYEANEKPNGLGVRNIALRNQVVKGQFKYKTPLDGGTKFMLFLKLTDHHVR